MNKLSYSIREVCAATSLGRTTIYAAIKSGELPMRKVGRRTVIMECDLIRWLNPEEQLPLDPASAANDSEK